MTTRRTKSQPTKKTRRALSPAEGRREVVDGFDIGTVVENPISDELSTGFLDYAVSVIVSRALPDVRDGLKPVQRRILYAMNAMGLRPDREYRKSARIVGDVMGKYHPHGDSAIYDAMVRLAQDWVMRVPLVDGQGNFGSPDDSPGAPRYTEARMATAALALTESLNEDVVDFQDNFDGSEVEPTILPARIPNLLVNGASGIAVGMATNMAPHNLREVADAIKLVLDNPKAQLADLLKVVKGPDFPTGGIVIHEGALGEIYRTGKGTVRLRGVATIEAEGRKRRIVITELPYTTSPERLITRVVEQVRDKKLEGIGGIADHTDRKSGLRIVIDLKNGVEPKAVLANLYALTPLEEKFAFNNVALVDGKPKTLGLRELIDEYIKFQLEIVVRRSEYRREAARKRLHIVAALVKALGEIDEVVAIIKKSRKTDTARQKLMSFLKIDETQANAILDMPLRRLTALEVSRLKEEEKELEKTIRDLTKLLGSEKLQRKVVAEELDEWVERIGDERRTRVVKEADDEFEAGSSVEVAEAPCVVTLSASGLIGRDEGGRRTPSADDLLLARVDATTTAEIFVITNQGRAYRTAAYDLPTAKGRSRGTKAGALLGLGRGEVPVGLWSSTELEAGRIPVFVTAKGRVKRVRPDDLSQMAVVSLIKLEEGDQVVYAGAAADDAMAVFATKDGQVLVTDASKIRPQGRTGSGMAGIGLGDGDVVIGAGCVDKAQLDTYDVVVVTAAGRIKASALSEYPAKGRATGGVRTIRLLKGETRLAYAGVLPAGQWAPVVDGAVVEAAVERTRRDASGEMLESGPATGAGWVRP